METTNVTEFTKHGNFKQSLNELKFNKVSNNILWFHKHSWYRVKKDVYIISWLVIAKVLSKWKTRFEEEKVNNEITLATALVPLTINKWSISCLKWMPSKSLTKIYWRKITLDWRKKDEVRFHSTGTPNATTCKKNNKTT